MQRAWTRLDTALVAGLGLLAVATRVAAMGKGAFSIDGTLLALGVEAYDFNAYRPHPPYYPLFIAVGKLLAPFVGPVHALTWQAVASSGVLAVFTFLVARQLAGRWAGLFAGGLVVASPVALLNGSVPLSYATEGAASVVLAWLALQARSRPSTGAAVALGVAASLCAGLRPSSLFVAIPLLAWSVWGHGRHAIAACLAGLVATALWLPAAILAGGGWDDFVFGLALQSRFFVLSRPAWVDGWDVVRLNSQWLAWHLRAEAAFFVAAAGLSTVAALRLAAPLRRRGPFLALWLLPPLAFFLLVYSGWPVFPSGYLMAVVPALAVAAAFVLAQLLHVARDATVARAARVGLVAVVFVVALLPVGWLGSWPDATEPIRAADAWDASWQGFDASFPPNSTAFLSLEGGAWVEFYHPDALAWFLQPFPAQGGLLLQVEQQQGGRLEKGVFANIRDGPADAVHPIPSHVLAIVLVDALPGTGPAGYLAEGVPVRESTLPSGRVVRWIDPTGLPSIESVLKDWGRLLPPADPAVAPPR